jgi:hypothetical protein
MRTTHTYAILEVSGSVYDEIKEKLVKAGYETHVMAPVLDGDRECVHLQGIAVAKASSAPANKGLTAKNRPPKLRK